eukprot:1233921-Prymnesium_polylepis.1
MVQCTTHSQCVSWAGGRMTSLSGVSSHLHANSRQIHEIFTDSRRIHAGFTPDSRRFTQVQAAFTPIQRAVLITT